MPYIAIKTAVSQKFIKIILIFADNLLNISFADERLSAEYPNSFRNKELLYGGEPAQYIE